MGKQDDLDDILGTTTTKGSKGKKAAAPAAKAKPTAKAKAISAKSKAVAAKKGKTAAKATNGTRSAKGQGKFFYDRDERAAVAKRIVAMVKKPTTTKELSEKLNLPTWKISNSARDLLKEKRIKLAKTGQVLTVSPR